MRVAIERGPGGGRPRWRPCGVSSASPSPRSSRPSACFRRTGARTAITKAFSFSAGRELEHVVLFMAVLAPEADHGPPRVICSPDQVAAASRAARAAGLAMLGQIHSHPGEMTWHSSGDNELVLMPYEGMLSIVVSHYARLGLRPLDSLGVHQFQDGRWVLAMPESVRDLDRAGLARPPPVMTPEQFQGGVLVAHAGLRSRVLRSRSSTDCRPRARRAFSCRPCAPDLAREPAGPRTRAAPVRRRPRRPTSLPRPRRAWNARRGDGRPGAGDQPVHRGRCGTDRS